MLPEWTDSLLSQSEPSEQIALLREAGLLTDEGLGDLLDEAQRLARRDPAGARRLAALCAMASESIGVLSLLPPAYYLQAQTHALDGSFEEALSLIDASRRDYEAQGDRVEALRTNIGLMSVLGELGRYREALDIAQSTLASLSIVESDMNSPDNATEVDADTLLALNAKITQNLGTCHKHLGEYAEALGAYTAAETHYRALGMQDETAEVMMNRAIALLHLGHGIQARDLCEAAVDIFTATDNTMRLAQAMENLGNIYLALGEYDRCLTILEQAGGLLAGGAPIEQYVLSSITADAYLALNLYPEAVAAYREAEAGLRAADMVYERAWTLWGLGAALAAQSHHREAAEALDSAASLFEQLENRHLLSAVMLEQAALLSALGQRGAALQTTRRALDMVSGRNWPVQHFYALLRLAELLMPGSLDTVETLLRQAESIMADLPLPHLRFRFHQRLGRLYRLQGRDREAEAILELAVQETEHIRGTLAREAVRISFLRDKSGVYEELIQLLLDRGDEAGLQKAFQVAEQAKSRALVDWLSGVVDTKSDTEIDPQVLARLQSLQDDLNAAYNELLGSDAEGERAAGAADVSQRIRDLENEILRLRLPLIGAKPAQSAGPAVDEDLPLAALRSELAPDVTLLAYHILGEEVLAFVYRDGELRVRRRLTTRTHVAQLLADLDVEWGRFRAGPEFLERQMMRLEQSARHLLEQLHKALIRPISADLFTETTKRLAIVPHGILHQAPFQAFFDGRHYLLERYLIGYAPSATVLLLCHRRRLRRVGDAVVVGVADPLIPHVTREARTVASQLPAARMLLDEEASIAAVRESILDCRLLHLACHGYFRADNPQFSALKLADGWLTAADVSHLSLDNAFVVLSACESGRSEAIGGDEIIGLIRSFLGAGAAGLAVSQWFVQDETTAELMTTFYGQGRARPGVDSVDPVAAAVDDPELDYAVSLREAQLALMSRYPHPYYWAPFIYVGRA